MIHPTTMAQTQVPPSTLWVAWREHVPSPRAPPALRFWLLLKSLALAPLQLLTFARLGFLLGLKPHDDFRDGHAGPPHTFLLEKA